MSDKTSRNSPHDPGLQMGEGGELSEIPEFIRSSEGATELTSQEEELGPDSTPDIQQ